jgi:hypothetical protein
VDSIWNIIPKITSPLAVICFAFYIFYLLKRSDDEKRKESLKVNDSQAQQKAVELIFKENPDISIDKITDPTGALELAKQIVADKLKRYQKTLNTLLIFSGIFALTFLISLIINNLRNDHLIAPLPVVIDKSFKTWAEEKAIHDNKHYAILSLMQHIKIEDLLISDTTKKRRAEIRDYYTIRALTDITNQDDVFEEQFLSNTTKIKPWAGSETQDIESIVDGRYWVKFQAKQNDIITIVTGANYFYDFPLSNANGTSCFGDVQMSNDEWFTCYPNSEDYIDNLTILIESSNVNLSLLPNATFRKTMDGSIVRNEGICKVYSTDNQCTLVAKFGKISPGECVGFKIKWD